MKRTLGVLFCVCLSLSGFAQVKPAKTSSAQAVPADLADILERCAAYCDRLSGAILDFVCLERIEEMVANVVIGDPTTGAAIAGFEDSGDLIGIAKSSDPGQVAFTVSTKKKVRSSFVYDYQLVRDRTGQITETRTLVKENGRTVLEKNAPLKTRVFSYKYIVMGPVAMLGRDRQDLFDFKIIKETTLGKERAVIIQATPKPGWHGDILSGKIWVRKSDAAVLKIEWSPESIGHYARVLALAKQIGANARLTLTTEFAFEHNGVRFPSRYTIEEMYLFSTRTPLVFSMTEVTSADYKYFTVETGVTVRK
ncbi:MAG: hypothetical protein MUQ25_12030 [Candidatus Aminicenantes bacterium]|nr:hypothetical protein [Candidatus Aminicenantes bacterium]